MMYPPVLETCLLLLITLQPLLLLKETLNYETFKDNSKCWLNASFHLKLQNSIVTDSYGQWEILKERSIGHMNSVFQLCLGVQQACQYLVNYKKQCIIFHNLWIDQALVLLHMMLAETQDIWKVQNGHAHIASCQGFRVEDLFLLQVEFSTIDTWASRQHGIWVLRRTIPKIEWRNYRYLKVHPWVFYTIPWAVFHSRHGTGTDQTQGEKKYILPVDGRVAGSRHKRVYEMRDIVETIFENTTYHAYTHKDVITDANKTSSSPGWCSSVHAALACKLKGYWFNS